MFTVPMMRVLFIFLALCGSAWAQDVRIPDLPPASDPLPPGTCFFGTQGDINIQACNNPPQNFPDMFGLTWAAPNTILMNPTASTANAVPTAMPDCTDIAGHHINRPANSAFTCGTSTPPAATSLARTRVTGLSFTGTLNTELMAGFGVATPTASVITLIATGRFQIDIAGMTTTTGAAGSSTLSLIRAYAGTGSPPTAGSAPPSPCTPPACQFLGSIEPSGSVAQGQSFSFPLELTGLSNGVPYWVDLSVTSPTQVPSANNAVLTNVSVRLIEN